MEFNFKTHYYFDVHYHHCALPKDMVDVEMTIWTVDGIRTYKRDGTTQVTSYSPWSRQVKPFSSLRKKIVKYKEEKKESHEKKNFNPFTPVRENKFGKKRSRRPQKIQKIGHGTFHAPNCSVYMADNNHHHHGKPVCSLWPA